MNTPPFYKLSAAPAGAAPSSPSRGTRVAGGASTPPFYKLPTPPGAPTAPSPGLAATGKGAQPVPWPNPAEYPVAKAELLVGTGPAMSSRSHPQTQSQMQPWPRPSVEDLVNVLAKPGLTTPPHLLAQWTNGGTHLTRFNYNAPVSSDRPRWRASQFPLTVLDGGRAPYCGAGTPKIQHQRAPASSRCKSRRGIPQLCAVAVFAFRCVPLTGAIETAHRPVQPLAPEPSKSSSATSSYPPSPEKKLREVQQKEKRGEEQKTRSESTTRSTEHRSSLEVAAQAVIHAEENGHAESKAEAPLPRGSAGVFTAPHPSEQTSFPSPAIGGAVPSVTPAGISASSASLHHQPAKPPPSAEAQEKTSEKPEVRSGLINAAAKPEQEQDASQPAANGAAVPRASSAHHERLAAAEDETAPQQWPLPDIPSGIASFANKSKRMLGREPVPLRTDPRREETGAGGGDELGLSALEMELVEDGGYGTAGKLFTAGKLLASRGADQVAWKFRFSSAQSAYVKTIRELRQRINDLVRQATDENFKLLKTSGVEDYKKAALDSLETLRDEARNTVKDAFPEGVPLTKECKKTGIQKKLKSYGPFGAQNQKEEAPELGKQLESLIDDLAIMQWTSCVPASTLGTTAEEAKDNGGELQLLKRVKEAGGLSLKERKELNTQFSYFI
eukprot:CAMPEP_0178982862 /NCGR_PEP_ID=MMETSP0795-20121207/732_1 /TAXON_ID=88552 /ORGANISM="Amoebophrya sp., Strain Ameob2" /LENGTH=669 /DNA_ID=CAMNT_0020673555 /DNA_START=122 /DNA_END=2132 /DNA_ORIENTATION=-